MDQETIAPHVEEITRALGNDVNKEEIAEELLKFLEYGVPLAQAKRDIIRNRGGSLRGVVRTLGSLTPEDGAVDVLAKVLTVNPKEVTTQGEKRQIFFGLLGDPTRTIAYTAWRDFGFKKGDVVRIRNAFVRVYRDNPDLSLGDRTAVEKVDEPLQVVERERPAVERKIRELGASGGNVVVRGRILGVAPREVTVQGEKRTIWSGDIADETGRTSFTAWADFRLQAGEAVEVKRAYVRSFRGAPDLNIGEAASVTPLPDDALPPAAALDKPTRVSVRELEDAGGARGVLLEGVLLDVKSGSGLVQRCPTCNRLLQRRECKIHGKVEGRPDLRVKGVLDDGTGAVMCFLNRQATEALLGATLEACLERSKSELSTDVIEDEVKERLVARRVRLTGNATSDEFGLMLLASRAEMALPADVAAEAAALLGELEEVA